MPAKTREKAPARWGVLLVSGLASAAFLWGVVNVPVQSQADAAQADNSTVAAVQSTATQATATRTATPALLQNVGSTVATSGRSPGRQSSTTTRSTTTTSRLRTRGS